MTHWLSVAGLALNTVGALFLLKFPPAVTMYTQKGEPFMQWVSNPTPDGRRRYLLQTWGFRAAIAFFVLGFLLQLIDLLRS
jgi:hypothetical protein